MITFIFPGQGSQYKGMGKELFDEFPQLVNQADEVLGYSIKELCIEDPHRVLNQTQFTQPALYTVNALSLLKKLKETGTKPDCVAGHSLGEYNALFAAGVFDFVTGLKLVKKRGELMSRARGGGMAAVLGINDSDVREILTRYSLNSVEIANINSPSQTVLSGPKEAIENAGSFFDSNGVRYIPLNVSGAFHSKYMSEAKNEFEFFLDAFNFSELEIPVISNVDAKPYKQRDIKKKLAEQITSTVQWVDTITYLMGHTGMVFEEIGPGDVLTKLVDVINREVKPQKLEEDIKLEEKLNTTSPLIVPEVLGDSQFKKDYNLKYPYVVGSMYRGISSKEMVVTMGKAGMMGFFGTGGLKIKEVEEAIKFIQNELKFGESYGMNLLYSLDSQKEEQMVDLFLKYNITRIEASAFMNITPSLVKYRVKGLKRNYKNEDEVTINNRIIAKISRPEVAEAFLSPAPKRIVEKMLKEGVISLEEAQMLEKVPMADEICAEADSGGHTDGAVALSLIPAMIKLRDEMMEKYKYVKRIRVGAAGGIGTPEAAAAAFILGADFIVTGSINQCTVEAGTSDSVKDLLQQMNVQDTEYAPAGDLFELGAKVQVLKKGVFFPTRANKLNELYKQYNSLEEIDEKNKKMLQERYFKRSFEQIYADIILDYPGEIERAKNNPKHKMLLVFKWYFRYSSRIALSGDCDSIVDYQVHTGPALGSFNQWVKGTSLESWRNRHVDHIAKKILVEAADILNQRLNSFTK